MVVLDWCRTNQFVNAVKRRVQYRPLPKQMGFFNCYGLKILILRQDHLRPGSPCSRSNASKGKTTGRVIDGIVCDPHQYRPAFRQDRTSAATRSGWEVAPRMGGDAKAAFTFISTRSPGFINASIPPRALNPVLREVTRSGPLTIHIRCLPSGILRSGICCMVAGVDREVESPSSYRARPPRPAKEAAPQARNSRIRNRRRLETVG